MKKTVSKPKQEGQNERHAPPHRQPQPNPQPNPQPQNQQRTAATATAAAAAAVVASPAPAVVVLPQSESSESTSTSTSSSWSTSLHEYGTGTVGTTSTSTSTEAFETGGGKAAGRKFRHRYSDTVYPGRRKRSSSTDAGVMTEPQSSSSKFWLYSLLAIVLTATTASAISMSLRAADAETDEPRNYVLLKQATTTRPPQCNCANGSATNTANPDAVSLDRRQFTTFEPQWRTAADGLDRGAAGGPDKSGTVNPDKADVAAGGGNASAVEHVGGEYGGTNKGVPQKVADKGSKSLVAYKIGPGRRKHGARTSTASRTPAKNDTGTRAAREVRTHANEGHPDSAAGLRPTLQHAAGTNEKNTTSQTAANVKHGVGEATVREPEKTLVNEYGDRQTPRAAARTDVNKTSDELGGSNAAASNTTAAQ